MTRSRPSKCPNGRGCGVCGDAGAVRRAREVNWPAIADFLGVPLDPAERAREKQASRDEDSRRLAAGEVTQEQLRTENGAFAFPRERVRLVGHCSCRQQGSWCDVHPTCVCGCERHAHWEYAGECIAGDPACFCTNYHAAPTYR